MERIKLHVRPVRFYGQQVLGDENLLRYLFELLEVKGEIASEVKDDNYVVFHVPYKTRDSLTSYLCRQIVRDHGEATNRRACGITEENQQITVILPRYNGKI